MKTNPWKDLFQLFRQEQKALIFFSLLLFAIIGVKISIPYLVEDEQFDSKMFNRFLAIQDSINQTLKFEALESYDTVDINAADTNDWKKLGFSIKQSIVIMNYRSKIGGFEYKEDLLDVFVVSQKAYGKIEAVLLVGENTFQDVKKVVPKEYPLSRVEDSTANFDNKSWSQDNSSYEKWENTSYKRKIIELNTADSGQLVSLYGIGPYFSRKILRYRARLGGYYSISQLMEIRNFDEETINKNLGYIVTDTNYLRKININTCTFKELLKHPYFDFYFTKKIFQYRDANGKFTYLRDLKNIEFIDSTYFERIRPYLSVD